MSKCIHYWVITNDDGKEVGRCKKCGEVRVFRNISNCDEKKRDTMPRFRTTRGIHTAKDPSPWQENAIKILEE